MKYVYLAGPISECDNGEANDWREYVTKKLAEKGIKAVSPLRCEPIRGEKYAGPLELNQADPKFGTSKAIASKNLFDVKQSDITLAFLPRAICERRPSYGTTDELAMAFAYGKTTIMVTDDPYIKNHPVVNVTAGWNLNTLDEAIEVIVGLMEVYSGSN